MVTTSVVWRLKIESAKELTNAATMVTFIPDATITCKTSVARKLA